MRLKNRQTTEEAAWQIVDSSTCGVLSMVDENGNPYAVPLNLWHDGNNLYFHSALKGFKTECLKKHSQVSVCFVSYAEVIPEELTTRYASAILSGTAEEVTDSDEKLKAIKQLCNYYNVRNNHPEFTENFSSCMPRTAVWKITVNEITGKVYK